MTDRYRTATHEAGHCLVVWAMDGEIEFTHLDDDGNGVTSMQVREATADDDWFAAWYGGEAGEVAIFRFAIGGDDEHDDGLTASDRVEIVKHHADVASRVGVEIATEMMLNGQRRALRYARGHARDIPPLAQELFRRGALQGDDLNRFRPPRRDFGPMR